MNNKIERIKFGILVTIILVCVGLAIYLNVKGVELDVTKISDYKYAPFYFVLFYIAISFIPLPIVPIMFVGGFIFPFFPAVFLTLLASIIFATITFYMARWLGRDYCEYLKSKNKNLNKSYLQLRQDPLENFLLLRLFFIIPGEIINVHAGLSRVKYKDFIIATIISSIPLIICCVGVIRSRIMQEWVGLIFSVLGLAIMLLIPIFFSKNIQDRIKNFKKKFI